MSARETGSCDVVGTHAFSMMQNGSSNFFIIIALGFQKFRPQSMHCKIQNHALQYQKYGMLIWKHAMGALGPKCDRSWTLADYFSVKNKFFEPVLF